MKKGPNKIAILISNYFAETPFDEPLKILTNVGSIDIISSESGKVKSWDKVEKQYHNIQLYKNEIKKVSAMEYNTIIVHGDLLNGTQGLNQDIVSFINKFMGRKKPIVVICQDEWTIIASTKPENKTLNLSVSENPFKISA